MKKFILTCLVLMIGAFISNQVFAQITITYPNLEYDATEKNISVNYPTPDIANDVITISYYLTGDIVKLPSAPKNVGTYDVKVIINGTNFSGTKTGTFSILPHHLDAQIYVDVSSVSRSYDGSVVADLPTLTIHGLFGGDAFSVANATATYDTKFAGTNKTVTVSGIVFSDLLLAANYTWETSYQNTTSTITPLPLHDDIYIEVANGVKIYDGKTSLDVPSLTVKGLIAGDVLIANGSEGTAEFDTKNAGTGKTITVSGIKFNDEFIANCYTWATIYQNKNSTITPRPLNSGTYIDLADQSKTYDGTTTIDAPALTIRGLMVGDNLTAITTNATTTFDTKNVGAGKKVTIKGFSFSDVDIAANYLWEESYSNTNGQITARPIDPNIYIKLADTTIVYDGKYTISAPRLTIMGLLGGDKFDVDKTSTTATINDPNVGSSKVVTATTFSFTNPVLAANYTWEQSYSNNTSTVIPLPITVSADPGQQIDPNNPDKIMTYKTTPLILPNNEKLKGLLTRTPGSEPGVYNILQGSVTDSNNPNYHITYVGNVIIQSPLSLSNTNDENPTTFYPNPTKDKINLSRTETIETIKILNTLGLPIWNGKGSDFPLDVSKWSKGTYIICFDEKGESKTIKILVQ